MSKEFGLFYPDGIFKSEDEIRRNFAQKKIFEDTTEFLRHAQRLEGKFDFGVKEATFHPIPEYPNAPIAIWHGTDIHYGSIHTNYDLLVRHLEIAENTPNFYIIFNGDDVDNFNTIGKWATGVYENPISPQRQAQAWIANIEELAEKGKIAVMSYGNHNNFTEPVGLDWLEVFARNIKTNIFTSGGLLHLLHGEQHYPIAITHRYWGNSKLNPTLMGKRLMEYEYPEAEVFLLGHTHQSEILKFDRGGKKRLISIGGTYKLDDRWARKQGISGRGGTPGHAILFYPYEHKFIGFDNIEDAQRILMKELK